MGFMFKDMYIVFEDTLHFTLWSITETHGAFFF